MRTPLRLSLFTFLATSPGLSAVALAAADGSGSDPFTTSAADKPFMLYMGADVDLQQDKQFFRVRDVAGRAFVITPNNQRVVVPVTGRNPVSFKVAKNLKVSDKVIRVSELKAERNYTPEADPFRKFANMAGNIAAAENQQNEMGVRLGEAARSLSMASANAAGNPGMPNSVGIATDTLNSYADGMQAMGAMMASEFNNSAAQADRLGADKDAQAFDAVQVYMMVSSAKPISHPYLIVYAQYRDPADKAGVVNNWVYATELDSINEVPRKIYFRQGGFPPGFELVKYEVHFYNHGQEVANTAAEKSVALTRDEAHEYIVVDYLTVHKRDTMPPSLALGAKSGEFRARYNDEQLRKTIFVKVTKDGLPQGVFRDKACTDKVDDPFMESVVGYARFKPALNEGKAVEGVAGIRLAELAL